MSNIKINLKVPELENKKIETERQIVSAKTGEINIFDKQTMVSEANEDLLGALLSELRKNKQMSLLMFCRQIDKIEVKDDVAEIYSENGNLREAVLNENYKRILNEFFNSKNLSFRVKEKQKKVDPIEELKKMFDDKLIVK